MLLKRVGGLKCLMNVMATKDYICTEDYQECGKCPRKNCFMGNIQKYVESIKEL